MVSGLSAQAVRGYTLSDDAIEALRAGDTKKLMELKRAQFGGFFMEKGKKDKDDTDTDTSGEDGDDDQDDDDDDDDDSDDTDTSGADDDSDDDSDDSDSDKVSKSEYERMKARMQAADKRASKAEKAEQDRKRKERTDLENAQGDLETATNRIKELESELGNVRLNNAFLAANKITWHDPETALQLAQTKGYLDDVADDDGEVDKKALSAALKKLAKENQYLVKRKADSDDDDDADDRGRGSSGESTGRRSRNNKDDDATKGKDARRAPSLGRRRPAVVGSRR